MSDVKWPEWRLIETAVKSCEPKLLYDGWLQMVGNYGMTFKKDGPLDGWYSGGEYCDPQPTHWMPLPPGPHGQIEERSDEVAAGKENSQPDTQEAIARTRP